MSEKYAHRKASKRVQIVDGAGNAISNTDVNIKLVNHEFLFGCGAFDAIPAAVPEDFEIPSIYENMKFDKSIFKDRMNKWLDLFNYGTLPFYWGGFEPEEGKPQTESRMNAAKLLNANGARVKGHPLCWHTVCADWLMKYDNNTILQKQLDRINRDVTAFKGVVDMWDVINEVVIMPIFDKYDNAITRICKDLGRVRLIKEVFAAAKAANPDGIFLINDFNLSESYKILIDGCLNAGVEISAIGLQTHQHQGYMGKEKLEEVLERFSSFGLPLHFTENTLVSGHIMPADIVDLNDYQIPEWPTTPEGEERQCKEWKEMYEILFDHPLVEAVTGWDFTDGAWLGAPSGLVRKDGSLKPSYHEIKRLAKEEWHTEGSVHTDDNGKTVLEGYKGTYEITCGDKKASFKLTSCSDDEVKIVLE